MSVSLVWSCFVIAVAVVEIATKGLPALCNRRPLIITVVRNDALCMNKSAEKHCRDWLGEICRTSLDISLTYSEIHSLGQKRDSLDARVQNEALEPPVRKELVLLRAKTLEQMLSLQDKIQDDCRKLEDLLNVGLADLKSRKIDPRSTDKEILELSNKVARGHELLKRQATTVNERFADYLKGVPLPSPLES